MAGPQRGNKDGLVEAGSSLRDRWPVDQTRTWIQFHCDTGGGPSLGRPCPPGARNRVQSSMGWTRSLGGNGDNLHSPGAPVPVLGDLA